MRLPAVILFIVGLAGSPALAQSREASPGAESAAVQDLSGVTIRPGDRLRFSVQEDAEASAELVVDSAGKVDLPLIGLYEIAGKTLDEARATAKRLLERDYLVKATVRILLVERPERSSHRGRVYLVGQFRKIGVVEIDLSETNTAGRVILANGGFTDFADSRKVRIVRKGPDGTEFSTVTVDLEEVLKKGRIDKDMPVRDGDFLIADAKLINW